MKQKVVLLIISILLASCQQSDVIEADDVNALKEALLRTRSVYSIQTNVDKNNPAKIYFESYFDNQLIEINFEAKKMANQDITILNNAQGANQNIESKITISGDMRIKANGIDITSCVINYCSDLKNNCQEQAGSFPSTTLSGNFDTNRIYVNLEDLREDEACSNFTIKRNGQMNVISFHEEKMDINPNNAYGAKINAQVIVYNRTYKAKDIKNIFGIW